MNINIDYVNPQSRDFVRNKLQKKHFSQKTLKSSLYSDALVMPNIIQKEKELGGVWTSDGVLVQASAFCEKETMQLDRFLVKSNRKEGRVIYIGMLIAGWGHGITDNLKKLWFIKTDECQKLLVSGAHIVYITHSNEELPSHLKKMITLAGYSVEAWERIVTPTVYDEVYVPDNSFYCLDMSTTEGRERYYTKEFLETISDIKASVKPDSSGLKLYLSRKSFCNHFRDIGEDRVEAVFVDMGYTSISPETLGVEDQIRMYMSATSIVATEGSIAHNAIFCDRNIDLVLLRKANYVNNYQKAINEMIDANVHYIDVHLYENDNGNRASGPFYVCVTTWLEKYVGHRILHIPYLLDWKWYVYKLRSNLGLIMMLKRMAQITK